MSKATPFRHEWTISGLSSMCDRITEHPYIKSIIDRRLNIRFYPKGYDESCGEYVSLRFLKPSLLDSTLSGFIYDVVFSKIAYDSVTLRVSFKNKKKEKLHVQELTIGWNLFNNKHAKIKDFIKRDYLLDPANDLTHDDKFTLCVEGWLHNREVTVQSNRKNKAKPSRDNFDFSPLLSTKSLALKWTIENVCNLFYSNELTIKLPQFKNGTATDEAIFLPRLEIIEFSHYFSSKQELSLKLQTNYKGAIGMETFVMDINQQKFHAKKKVFGRFGTAVHMYLNHKYLNHGFIHDFRIDKKIYSSQSIVSDNRLTLFCVIKRLTDSTKKINKNRKNYSRILECLEEQSDLQITEWTVNGKTGFTRQNIVRPSPSVGKDIEIGNENPKKFENIITEQTSTVDDASSSSSEENEIEIEKLEQLSNSITEQTSSLDNATITVNNVYNKHYFKNCNIKNSLVNTNSKSTFGNISFKSEKTDCTDLIEKLENVVSSEIEPVLNQNERIYIELKSFAANLFAEVLTNQQEMKTELNALQSELSQMKQTKKVNKSKMKKIVDRIVALLNRIKYELNKVCTKVSIKVTQVRQSKPSPPKSPEPTLAKSNSITEYIEPHISSLIECVQSVTISQSNSTETKQSHIHKLKTVKAFLIAHLSTKNCSTINPNAHMEIDSITLENAEHKLANIIHNHRSNWDKKLLTKLRDLIADAKAESSTVLSDNAEDTEDKK